MYEVALSELASPKTERDFVTSGKIVDLLLFTIRFPSYRVTEKL